MPITAKARSGYLTLTLHSAGNNGVTTYVTRSSTNAAVAANNTASETVSTMEIKNITFSLGPTANAIVMRGANTVFRCWGTTQELDFQGGCTPLEVSLGDKVANCVIRLNGPGSVVVQLKKYASISNYNNPQFPNG